MEYSKIAILNRRNILTGILSTGMLSYSNISTAGLRKMSGYKVILVIGQSNAVGRGFGEFSYNPTALANMSRVFQIGRHNDQNNKIIPAIDPLHHWQNLNDGSIGFATTLAGLIASKTTSDKKILIVPCAMGGTSIMKWDEEVSYIGDNTDLYSDAITRTVRALNAGITNGYENELVGICWQQGEADITITVDPTYQFYDPNDTNGAIAAYKYAARLGSLFSRLRKDLPGNYPIFAGLPAPGWIPLRNNDNLIAKRRFENAIKFTCESMNNTFFVSSNGLLTNHEKFGTGGDPIHFCAESQVLLGERYFNLWKTWYNL